jgi:hypothetical protein
MSDRVVVLTSFLHPADAHLARSMLEEAGIECMLADENISSIRPSYARLAGGVKLMVRESDAEAAAEVLGRVAARRAEAAPPDDPTRCPECGSEEVVRKSLALWFLLAGLLCLGLPFAFTRTRWRCPACGHQWRDP